MIFLFKQILKYIFGSSLVLSAGGRFSSFGFAEVLACVSGKTKCAKCVVGLFFSVRSMLHGRLFRVTHNGSRL